MASLIDSFLGQQDTPDFTTLSPQQIMKAVFKAAPKIAESTIDYNKILAPGIAEAQRAGEDVYDPNRGAIRDRAGELIRQSLENPFSLPPDVAAQIRQQGFEQGGITGTGVSNASQANVARNLGLTSLDLGNYNINRGAGYGSNTANLWQPQSIGITPGDAGSMLMNQNTQQNAFNKYMSDLGQQNMMNLINRPLSIGNQLGSLAGQAAGAYSAFSGGTPSGASLSTQMFASPQGTTWNLPGGGTYTK